MIFEDFYCNLRCALRLAFVMVYMGECLYKCLDYSSCSENEHKL